MTGLSADSAETEVSRYRLLSRPLSTHQPVHEGVHADAVVVGIHDVERLESGDVGTDRVDRVGDEFDGTRIPTQSADDNFVVAAPDDVLDESDNNISPKAIPVLVTAGTSIVDSMFTKTSASSQDVTNTFLGLWAERPSVSSSSKRLGCPAAGNVASSAAVAAAR